MHSRRPNTKLRRDAPHAEAIIAKPPHVARDLVANTWPTTDATLSPRTRKPCQHTLADQRTLKLGEYPEHLEHRAPCRRAGV
jgi:hypothetical protein